MYNANAKTKTVYDPSPVGFRVPAPDAWNGFNLSNFTWGAVGGDNGRTYGPSGLFFPATDCRDGYTGGVSRLVGHSIYWSSCPSMEILGGYTLRFNSRDVNPWNGNGRACGFPVRCVKE